jgi:hypothetical protein
MNPYDRPPYGPNQPTAPYTQYQPPPGQRPPLPHERFTAWYGRMWRKSKAITLLITVVILLFSCGICTAVTNANPKNYAAIQSSPTQLVQRQATPKPTATSKPTSVPTPTPTPKVFFDQSNQNSNLPIENSTAFSASGTLKIEYSCIHSYKDGVDVQLNVMPVDADGTLSFDGRQSWIVKLSCPDRGSDTFNANGLYKVTAATGGSVGWSLKITQA